MQPLTVHTHKTMCATRKALEIQGSALFPITPTSHGYVCLPRGFLPHHFSVAHHLPLLIVSFDANVILNQASTMAAVRLLPKASVHAKLQDPKEVIPALRTLGNDDPPMMEELQEFYSDIQTLSQVGFTDREGKTVEKIEGDTFFSPLLCLLSSTSKNFFFSSSFFSSAVVHTLDMKSMKVAMNLEKVHCVLCDQDASIKAVITDAEGAPASLEDLYSAFLTNPSTFHELFSPLRSPIGRPLGAKALPGLTSHNVVLCIMHGEIRVVINICQYHLRAVSLTPLFSTFFKCSSSRPLFRRSIDAQTPLSRRRNIGLSRVRLFPFLGLDHHHPQT